VVTLDGLNQDDPTFIFQAMSTLVTAADTKFILKNGATAQNVIWALGTTPATPHHEPLDPEP